MEMYQIENVIQFNFFFKSVNQIDQIPFSQF
jgi:hypothetical protein